MTPPVAGPRRRLVSRGPAARAETIDDLRAMALRRLPRFSAEYLEGGAEDERSLHGNRAAFDDYTLHHRVLCDISDVDPGVTLWGRRMALPFGIGPTGFNGLLWPDGDRVLAQAAAAAGIPFGQSTVSNATIPHIAAVPGLRHWFQLYCYGPDRVWETLVDSGFRRGADVVMARALGADAVLMGRATLYGLAAGGPAGVARAIGILRAEVVRTLQLLGITRMDELSPAVFARGPGI